MNLGDFPDRQSARNAMLAQIGKERAEHMGTIRSKQSQGAQLCACQGIPDHQIFRKMIIVGIELIWPAMKKVAAVGRENAPIARIESRG